MAESSDPHVVVFHRRGRPRASAPLQASVTTWLPSELADALYQLARRRDAKVSAVVREILTVELRSNCSG